MLWIHDGIWLYPSPPELLMQQAEHFAQHSTGMDLSFQFKQLKEEHLSALETLQGLPLHTHAIPPSVAQLRKLGHQEWWAQVHKGPGQLPQVVHRQLRHATAPPHIDSTNTLRKFFVRTSKA